MRYRLNDVGYFTANIEAIGDEVISLIDITPTTLGFAGIDRPLGMHGRLFLGDKRGPPRHLDGRNPGPGSLPRTTRSRCPLQKGNARLVRHAGVVQEWGMKG